MIIQTSLLYFQDSINEHDRVNKGHYDAVLSGKYLVELDVKDQTATYLESQKHYMLKLIIAQIDTPSLYIQECEEKSEYGDWQYPFDLIYLIWLECLVQANEYYQPYNPIGYHYELQVQVLRVSYVTSVNALVHESRNFMGDDYQSGNVKLLFYPTIGQMWWQLVQDLVLLGLKLIPKFE